MIVTDVVIAGAGVIGCATAAFLRWMDPAVWVSVIEPDPAYGQAASLQAPGGVRQLFSCPENAMMSAYTLRVIGDWPGFLAAAEDLPDLGWRPNGYLFAADPSREGWLASLAGAVAGPAPSGWSLMRWHAGFRPCAPTIWSARCFRAGRMARPACLPDRPSVQGQAPGRPVHHRPGGGLWGIAIGTYPARGRARIGRPGQGGGLRQQRRMLGAGHGEPAGHAPAG
jgi:hypothetical protein